MYRSGFIASLVVTLRSKDADDIENVIKTIGSISKTTTSHVHHSFLYTSFPFLHDYDVKMPNFAFFRGRKQLSNDEILFLFPTLNLVPWNSASGGFAYISQSKWLGIIAIKTERTQVHFLSDVLVAVASLDLQVYIAYLWRLVLLHSNLNYTIINLYRAWFRLLLLHFFSFLGSE